MANVQCPSCSGLVATDPRLSGQIVACPHCSSHIKMPAITAGRPNVAPPPARPAAPRQPVRPADDDEMGDVRSGPSLGLVIGVVAAALGLILVVGGTIVVVTIGRPALEARREAAARAEAQKKEKQSAVEIVDRTLRKYGYTHTHGDISLKKNDNLWSITGWTHGDGQPDVPFRCVYTVQQRGRTNSWNLKLVMVEGETRYEAVVP